MNSKINEMFGALFASSIMPVESIYKLALDINGADFASTCITTDTDIESLNYYVVAITIAALQLLDGKKFSMFATYYGIGREKKDIDVIARSHRMTEYDVALIITQTTDAIGEACKIKV